MKNKKDKSLVESDDKSKPKQKGGISIMYPPYINNEDVLRMERQVREKTLQISQ